MTNARTGVIADGRERLRDGYGKDLRRQVREAVRREVAAEYAHALADAGFAERVRIRLRMRGQICERLPARLAEAAKRAGRAPEASGEALF